jgi:AAA+ superfamily predicted ATPase
MTADTSPAATAPAATALSWLGFGQEMVAILKTARGLVEPLAGSRDSTEPVVSERRRSAIEGFVNALSEPSAFSMLVSNVGLDADEAQVFALLLAVEVDASLHFEVAALQRDNARNRLTLGTIVEAFTGAAGHRGVLAVAPDSALARAGMIELHADGPWSDHLVAVHPSVVWALLGDTSVDPGLPPVIARIDTDQIGGSSLTVVSGEDVIRRRQAAILHTLGSRFIVVAAPADEAGWTALVREATVTGAGVVLEVDDALPAVGRRWIERAAHVAWAVSSRRDLALDDIPRRAWLAVQAETHPVTDVEWTSVIGSDLGRTHHLTPSQLDRVGRVLPAVDGDVDRAVRRLASGGLETLARRIRPRRSWGDIVLSPDRKQLLRSIVDRYIHADTVYRTWGFSTTASHGLVALFSGPSGTGKTLAAEVIAFELGLDVFKLDLSSVVSKYIGETEKNLELVFDAAGAGNMVLFFDEADALFGKRSEVKDARDRYANIEVSYLLQRLEAYEGLVVMATNFEKNVDEAFLRRIHARIEFELPGPPERATIWRQNLPAAAPVGELDIDWLAESFEITGGSIRNAVVHAAFIAASSGRPIDTEIAAIGVAREYRKVGRLLKAADFGVYHDAVTATTASAE